MLTLNIDDVCRVQDGLSAAALGEATFAEALNKLIHVHGGAGGVVFEMNRRTGEIINWVGPGLEAGEVEYAERLNAINPRMRYSLRHAAGHVAYEGLFIDERAIDRHEFYDTIGRISDMRYFLGSRVYDDGDMSLFHSVEFATAHGHPEADKIEAFSRLAPAVGNAWRLAKRRTPMPMNAPCAWTPDHLPWAIFALARDGRVIGLNAQAGAMVADGMGLRLDDGLLAAASRRSRNALNRALARALGGEASETLVERLHAPALILQALPVPAAQQVDPSQPRAVVYVRDAQRTPPGRARAVQRLFRLTDAETRVVELLACGRTLNDIADDLMLTRNTVRNHLQAVFAKTGTRRQGELLAQILGVVGD